MHTETTNGIKVTVETFYQDTYSKPREAKYLFAYRVTIENQSTDTVRLLRRHWSIFDSDGIAKEVRGEGVVGEKPVIEPNGLHQYVSWCDLTTDMGRMSGSYEMKNLTKGGLFHVQIPPFQLIAPFKGN